MSVKARGRSLLLAAALAAILAALVGIALHGVERPDEAARARHEAEARALPFHPGNAVALSIAHRGGAEVRAVREGGTWRLSSGGPTAPGVVEGLLDRLASARVRSTLPASPDVLPARGLAPPLSRVIVTVAGGNTLSLDLGDENPFDHARFARRDGRILVVDGVPAALVDPDPGRLLAPAGGG